MHLRYRVDLEASERRQFEEIVTGGTRAVRRVKRGQILLAAAAGRPEGRRDYHDRASRHLDRLPHETPIRGKESRGGVVRGRAAGRHAEADGE